MTDTDELLSVDGVARTLASAAGGLDRRHYARQIRSWAQRGLLEPVQVVGLGRTAARLFDRDAPCRARLLSYLTATGMAPGQMHPVMEAVAAEQTVERVRAGEAKTLTIELDWSGAVRAAHTLSAPDAFVGSTSPGSLVIDVHELWGPLMRQDGGDGR